MHIMKKNIIAIFVLFFMLFTSAGCKKYDSFKDIEEVTLEEMKNNEESFFLFVYQPGCYGCERFKPILDSAIEEKQMIVYGINIRIVENDFNLMTSIEYTPSLVVYKKGKIEFVADPAKNQEYFIDKDGVLDFFDDYMGVIVGEE